MCAVALNRITERQLYEMLTIPSHGIWPLMERQNLVTTAPACGLFLHSIVYKAEEEFGKVQENTRGVQDQSFFDNRLYGVRKRPT